MYDVTTKSVSGSVVSVTAHSNGEVIDRLRNAMASEYVIEFTVTKSIENLLSPVGEVKEPWSKCNHKCEPTHEALMPESKHYLDCPVWNFNY
jgi:hypothetical protein